MISLEIAPPFPWKYFNCHHYHYSITDQALKLQSFYSLKGLVVSFTVARLSEKAQNSPSKYKISPNISYEMVKLTLAGQTYNILWVMADFVKTISPPVWVYEYIWQGGSVIRDLIYLTLHILSRVQTLLATQARLAERGMWRGWSDNARKW